MAYFEEADEVLLEIATYVIERYHPKLRGANFGFAFRSEAATSRGKRILAAVSKVSATVKIHVDFDYLIWVAKDAWDHMTHEKRAALLDHEFCHCVQNDNFEWTMRDHDIQEFVEIIERHGLWTNDLHRMAEAVQEYLPGISGNLDLGTEEGAVTAAPVSMFS